MSNRKLQKEVETVFKKIHEGLDLFNYYFSRHESSTNDSQREKLESDLKKEIKKLQKFRDQIKNWQGNDSLEATIAPQKLQEHRRLVEEAMECYKDVEKHSKMKSFSNQSIMLAALDGNDHDLSADVKEAVNYLSEVIETLTTQNEELDEEYEKLSHKKVRKNNVSSIEDRKQEIDGFRSRNEFHLENIETVIGYLKRNRLSADSIWEIQEDLNFYLDSNQEPDFIDDDTLYDQILKEAKENQLKNTSLLNIAEDHFGNGDTDYDTVDTSSVLENHKTPEPSIEEHPKHKHSSTPPSSLPSTSDGVATPSKNSVQASTPKGKSAGKQPVVDSSSPAFITTLKPASTPSKPVGALKWSIAAAGNGQTSDNSNGSMNEKVPAKSTSIEKESSSAQTDPVKSQPAAKAKNEETTSAELLSLLNQSNEFSPYIEVLKNSELSPVELGLFCDSSLLRSPPGIQEFAVSFASENKISQSGKLLIKPKHASPFSGHIRKPYLPSNLAGHGLHSFKPPLFLGKLQNYWNRIRAGNSYERFLDELDSLEKQSTPDSEIIKNEMIMVLFYGYYYGFLPLENIIAESMLHRLGWRPYELHADGKPLHSKAKSSQTQFWLKSAGESTSTSEAGVTFAIGDYKVFDLGTWEIHVKPNFKFDTRFSRSQPLGKLV